MIQMAQALPFLLQLLQGGGQQTPPAPGLPQMPNTLESMRPTQGSVSPGASDGTKSAHNRSMVQADSQIEVTAPAPPPMPLLPAQESLGPTVTGPEPTSAVGPGHGQVPDQFLGMDPLQLAMLGLQLGSALFQPEQGPRPPGLPGSSMSPMRPVFRG